MKHIQPFKIFEGLLKPRDINSRKERHKKQLALKYPKPNLVPFDNEKAEYFAKHLTRRLNTEVFNKVPFIKLSFIKAVMDDSEYYLLMDIMIKHYDTKPNAKKHTNYFITAITININQTNHNTYNVIIKKSLGDEHYEDPEQYLSHQAQASHKECDEQDLFDIITDYVKTEIDNEIEQS